MLPQQKLIATDNKDEMDFNNLANPKGICKNCIISVCTKRPIKVRLWVAHGKSGINKKKMRKLGDHANDMVVMLKS